MSLPPSGKNPSDKITIIMVAHGRSDVVRQTLASLAKCEQPAAFAGLVLVENGPPCGMSEAIAPFQDQLRITHETVSSSKKTVALNHALKLIGTGWALFIDDDVRVSPDWISLYADAIAREPEGYYFGGPTSADFEVRPAEWLLPFLGNSTKGLSFPAGQTEIVYSAIFLGFNWCASIEHLLDLGGFSEDFGPGTQFCGADESFMQMHLCRSGLRGRIVPEALVWHQIPAGRCTPPWCLRRAYLSGLIKGLLAARYEQRRPRLLGGIRCVLGNVRTRLTSLPLKEVIRLSRPGRFAVRSALKWMHGFIVGYRQAQWNNIDPMAVTTNSASKLSLTSTATVSHS